MMVASDRVQPVGFVRSSLRQREAAPNQGSEGAPDAWLDVDPAFAEALEGLREGDDVIVITWLHRADRTILKVHPQGNPQLPLTGVFATRSPDRPNPLGLHRVTLRAIAGTRLRVGPLEAIDGTPVVDIKPVLMPAAEGEPPIDAPLAWDPCAPSPFDDVAFGSYRARPANTAAERHGT